MLTKTKRKQYESVLKRLKKCDGDCKHCEKCHIYFSDSKDGRTRYYAFGCDLLPLTEFSSISNTMRDLKSEAIEIIEFELK